MSPSRDARSGGGPAREEDCKMKRRTRSISPYWQLLLGFVLSLGVAWADVSNGNELVRNSPFLPEGYQPPSDRRPTPPPARPPPPAGPDPLDRIEFRGMANFGGKTEFSLFDPAQKRSFWIGLGRTDGGFTIEEYKEKEDAVVVRHEGKARTISLHESKIAALAPDTPTPPTPRETGNRTAPAAQPENPEERMKNLADEIRRRREIRRALVEEAEANNQ